MDWPEDNGATVERWKSISTDKGGVWREAITNGTNCCFQENSLEDIRFNRRSLPGPRTLSPSNLTPPRPLKGPLRTIRQKFFRRKEEEERRRACVSKAAKSSFKTQPCLHRRMKRSARSRIRMRDRKPRQPLSFSALAPRIPAGTTFPYSVLGLRSPSSPPSSARDGRKRRVTNTIKSASFRSVCGSRIWLPKPPIDRASHSHRVDTQPFSFRFRSSDLAVSVRPSATLPPPRRPRVPYRSFPTASCAFWRAKTPVVDGSPDSPNSHIIPQGYPYLADFGQHPRGPICSDLRNGGVQVGRTRARDSSSDGWPTPRPRGGGGLKGRGWIGNFRYGGLIRRGGLI